MPHFRTVIAQNDLRMQPFEGDTWFARGFPSKIDFFFCRGLGVDFSIQNRADLRLGLPSDHNALVLGAKSKEPFLRPAYRKTLCGRWDVDEGRAEAAALEHMGSGFKLSVLDQIRCLSAVKPPCLRYVHPPLRRNDPDWSCRFMKQGDNLRKIIRFIFWNLRVEEIDVS